MIKYIGYIIKIGGVKLSYASDMKKELTLIEITQDREFLSELSALIKMNGILTIANGRLSLSFQTEILICTL